MDAVILEIPSDERGDSFRVRTADGEVFVVEGRYHPHRHEKGDACRLTLWVEGKRRSPATLRPADGVAREFQRAPGTVDRQEGVTRVWTGYRWVSAREAVERSLVELEDLGQHIATETVGGGAYGGPGEYTLDAHLWAIDDFFVLDVRELAGDSFEFHETESSARESIHEIAATFEPREPE